MSIKPLHDRVLLRRCKPAETGKGGIIIPDSAQEKSMEAEVVAVGEGRFDQDGRRIALTVKAGCKVLVGKYTGTEVKDREADLVIVREDEILAILT